MKKLLCGVYTVVWQGLRVCAALLLCWWGGCVYWAIDESVRHDTPKVEHDPYMCGKISGVTYEFPREYGAFWPEYEGKSSWEAGFTKNKKGCEANFRSVTLTMSWPELLADNNSRIFTQGLSYEGLQVSLEPIERPRPDLRPLLNYYLKDTPAASLHGVRFISALGLNHLEGVDYMFKVSRKSYYWSDENGAVKYVGYCIWSEREQRYYSCKFSYVLSGNIFVEVQFTPEKLNVWADIVSAVDTLVKGSIKN
ncbi:hypothetical protein PS627_00847 [Pseudomonas fluorescens]|uniref:hypothetical protein n=1 Tax=Pseudomonas fluorescens TaxID=294 RepID=UPI00125AA981|nr:hypothetical protein [Pseudomonas fluorescens]CAG8864072.1 hypothetical protein PS627_00847 [Pseudomonas fluorescens]VVP94289.1 hypothetical protein PS910_03177 [Pseudomonas fluorescens]